MKLTYKESSQLLESEVVKTASSLTAYVKHLQEVANDSQYSEPESSINLPTDKELYEKVLAVKKEKDTDHIKYFIDIGIGGSNLGAKAVYDAFYGYYDLLQPNRYPKGIFLDTVDEEVLAKLGMFIEAVENKNEILVNAIREVSKIMKEAMEKAEKTIKDNKNLLDAIAKKVMEVETMERAEFEELLKAHGVTPKQKLDIEHQK
jgi:hypothetical protein